MKNFTDRWICFFRERFPLRYAIPVILLFVLGNSAIAGEAINAVPPWDHVVIAMVMCISFFYRLVIFTELHDYRYDCRWNPDKPLPRGLISLSEGVYVGFGTIALELALTAWVGYYSFTVHLLPITWSLLVWRDFFIPRFMSGHPVIAVFLRGIVLALCGYSVGVTSFERSLFSFPLYFYFFGLANWAVYCFYYVLVHSGERYEQLNFRYLLGVKVDLLFILLFPIVMGVVVHQLWLWISLLVLLPLIVYRKLSEKTIYQAAILFIYVFYIGLIVG